MNKKEIEDMFETLTKQWGDTDNYVNDLLSYSKNLQQENKKLKSIIKTLIKEFDLVPTEYVKNLLGGDNNE